MSVSPPIARMSPERALHWLALCLVPGLGPQRIRTLLERYGAPEAIFRASASELEAAGAPPGPARSIAAGCTFDDALLQHERVEREGVTLIGLRDPAYPPLLRAIHDPPVLLFAKGRLELLASPMLAIVGTRRPTAYGRNVAERFAFDLARAGLTVVSGMARGVDTWAHEGALKAGGATVAVFGAGLDHIYPAENRKLAEQIAAEGLLLSEFPMGTPAHPQNFPIRNRIISGLSEGVLVVEGAQYSGSAITAKMALEQQREVFAVPGNVTSKMSWGPNLLIKQGATLVQEASDVIEGLPKQTRRRLAERREEAGGEAVAEADEGGQGSLPLGPAAEIQQWLLKLLRPDQALHVDEILEKVENYSSSETLAALMELEVAGLIRQLPGRNFVKVW